MARPRPALLAVLGVLAVGAALAAPRQFSRPDPLEGVKTSIRLKKFAEAATALQKLAGAGNAEAQYMLAVFYLNGVNGPRDPKQAKGWLEKSAGQGNARAAFSLANLFAESDPPDRQAAEHWLARARQLGFSAPTAPPGAAAAQQGPPSSLLPAAQLKDPGVRREALWLAATDGDVPSLESLADPALVSARDERPTRRGRSSARRRSERRAARRAGLVGPRLRRGQGRRRHRRAAAREGCDGPAPQRHRVGEPAHFRAESPARSVRRLAGSGGRRQS